MKIKFHETVYTLVNNPYVFSTRFSAVFEKGENTFDDIIADTLNAETITVYDDEDEVKGIYTGYTTRIALYVLDNNDSVSLELLNTDVEARIEELTGTVSSLDAGVTELAENIATLNETQDSQDAAIEELAENIL